MHLALGVLLALLAVASLVSGLRLDDDSYQHFARSFQQVSTLNLSAWLLDIWNKPLTGLLYGTVGLFGLHAARLVSVGLTVATALLTALLCKRLVPERLAGGLWFAVVFFAAQMAVLKDAFVTMTEGPAAFFVALALWLCLVRQRYALAALCAGLVPLCRAEMVPVVGFMGLWLALATWRERQVRGTGPWGWAVPLLLAGLPFVLWVGAGILASHDLHWFSRGSYAYLRSWDLAGVLRHNVLSGLPAVLAAPALFLFFVGIFGAPRLLHSRNERFALYLLMGTLGLHYLLLNTLVVFPKGWLGLPAGHAVAAVNARNYTPTAPIAAVFIAFGVSLWVQWGPGFRRLLVLASAFSIAAIVLGRFGSWGQLGLDLLLLGLMNAVVLGPKHAREHWPPDRFWKIAAAATLVGAFLVRPFFWYPTLWNDKRGSSVEALLQLVRQERPLRVVQDIASAPEVFGALQGVDAHWIYPHLFLEQALSGPSPTLLVVETDASGQPAKRYPENFVQELKRATLAHLAADAPPKSPQFQLISRFSSPPEAAWLTLTDRLAAKNSPVHWAAYRVLHSAQINVSNDPFPH